MRCPASCLQLHELRGALKCASSAEQGRAEALRHARLQLARLKQQLDERLAALGR